METKDLTKWKEIVVVINKTNWIDVLLELFEKIDSRFLPHYRLAVHKGTYGISFRLFSPNEKTISDLIEIATTRNLENSIDPKTRDDDPLRELSGWYDDLKQPGLSPARSFLLHSLSQLAINALKQGFTNSGARKVISHELAKLSHQFCNMMAVVDVLSYHSLFDMQ